MVVGGGAEICPRGGGMGPRRFPGPNTQPATLLRTPVPTSCSAPAAGRASASSLGFQGSCTQGGEGVARGWVAARVLTRARRSAPAAQGGVPPLGLAESAQGCSLRRWRSCLPRRRAPARPGALDLNSSPLSLRVALNSPVFSSTRWAHSKDEIR